MDIKEKIVRIIAEQLGTQEIEINEETTLTSDLGYDSLMIFEMVVEIETRFNIQIPDEYLDVDLLDRVGNIVEIVKRLV